MRNGTTIAPSRTEQTGRIDLSTTDSEQAIAEVFGDQPRAAYWRELKETLESRLKDARQERDALPEIHPERSLLEKRIAELREQVHALATEEAVTQFLEDSLMATLARPVQTGSPYDGDWDEFEE